MKFIIYNLNSLFVLGFIILAFVFPTSIAATNLIWLLLLLLWIVMLFKNNKDLSIFKDKINYPLYAFIIATFISIIFSINFRESILEIRKIGQILIMYLFWSHIKTKGDFKRFIKFLIMSATIVSIFGILQYIANIHIEYINEKIVFHGPKWLLALPDNILKILSLDDRRARGTQSLPLTFSELILLIFPFSVIYVFEFSKKLNQKIKVQSNSKIEYFSKYICTKIRAQSFKENFYFLSPMVMFIAIILSFTRGAWLGLFSIVITLLIIYRKRSRKVVYLITLLVLLLVLIPLTAKNKISISDRIKSIVDVEFNLGRINMWASGMRIIKDYPVLGIGPRCLPEIYSKYALKSARSKHEGHLHSNFMQILVDRGVLGFLAFCLFLITFLVYFIRKYIYSQDDFSKYYNLAIFLSILSFIVSGITEYSFGDAEVIMLFWGILGIGLALNKNNITLKEEKTKIFNYVYIKELIHKIIDEVYRGIDKFGIEYFLSVGFIALAFVYPISIVLTNIVWLSLLFVWLIKQFKLRKIPRIFAENINYPMYGFILVSIISIIFSIDFFESLLELKKIGQVFILYIIWDSLNTEKAIYKFIRTLVFSGALIALLGIIQYLLNISYPYYIPNSFSDTPKFILKFMSLSFGRVKGTRSIPLTFAEVMLLIFPFSLMISLYFNKQNTKKFVYHIYKWAPIIIAMSIIFTFARIVIISMVILAIIVALSNKVFMRKFIKVCLAILGIYFIIFFSSTIITRGSRVSIVDRFSELYYFRTKSARIYMWEAGRKIIKNYPVIGIGPRCVPKVYANYVSSKARSKHEGHLHSNFVHIATERGLLGFLAFCVFLGTFFVVFWKNLLRSTTKFSKYMNFAVFLSFLGFIMSGVSEYSFGDSEVAMLFWGVLGLGLAIQKLNKKEVHSE